MSVNPELSILFDFYGEMLTDRQKDAIRCYYDDDLSLSEIAQNFGVNRQAVHDSIKRAEVMLYDMEKRLGMVRRDRKVQAALQGMTEAARRIEAVNQNFRFSSDITELTAQILELAGTLSE